MNSPLARAVITFHSLILVVAGLVSASCRRAPNPAPAATRATGPFPQHVFVWQRQWTRPVQSAVATHGAGFASLGVFGGQIEAADSSTITVIKPSLDWNALAAAGRPVTPVFRLEHLNDVPAGRHLTIEKLRDLALDFIRDASRAGVEVTAVIIDYDCPQNKLAAYASWLAAARPALKPMALLITALPSWLGEQDLPPLLDQSDGWILQVHSFDLTVLDRRPAICDPEQAAAWVEQAATLGRPFAVALSTYRATAALDPQGRRVGLALEGRAPAWPPGTREIELNSDPVGLATLVARWQTNRPATLKSVWWYRLPVETDTRNWRWVTLQAVMDGRAPYARWEVVASGRNPIDFTLCQVGEADGPPPARITIDWPDHAPAAADALRGWSVDFPGRHGSVNQSKAEFTPTAETSTRHIAPGTRAAIGWLRYHEDLPSPDRLQITVVR